ncbi:hypothetical protein EPK99_12115 [Neorhizobium lilium]|uniref:Uncharacterized protein n=1 Tax=Neorhizobium lilium TaxID=2503024 RepID=A0A444LJX1_9HYPH|nr:hypothetical protein [Neorhizobium lilium]RWX79291.1 hypothetical protein EPK99_12115 [Neorhizobium lilium]
MNEADDMTNRSNGKVLVVALVIVLAIGALGYFVGMMPATAPSNPPDRAGTETRLPAGPADPRTQAPTSSVDPSKP